MHRYWDIPRKSLQERKRGTFEPKDLGNMDQTSLYFIMDNNMT